MTRGLILSSTIGFERPSAIARRSVRVEAVVSPSFLGECPPKAMSTVQSIREAVAHSTCGPYAEMASETTTVINPPWADEPRATGISHAECGIVTDTKYAEESVRPIAASYETDGSVFLLWERKAEYSRGDTKHSEDICGVTYVKMSTDGKASLIATFRQPSPEEVAACFKPSFDLKLQPGASSFFRGAFNDTDTPVGEQQMLASARSYYTSLQPGQVASGLATIAAPGMQLFDPCWTPNATVGPSRDEAAAAMEEYMASAGGELNFDVQAIAHAEGTNMVFALWFASGPAQPEMAGVDIFCFGDDLKIKSISTFREPLAAQRDAALP
eukprot:jgi/Ulvmu1/11850/UM081_0008.1